MPAGLRATSSELMVAQSFKRAPPPRAHRLSSAHAPGRPLAAHGCVPPAPDHRAVAASPDPWSAPPRPRRSGDSRPPRRPPRGESLRAERPGQPGRSPRDEAADVVPADHGNVIPEPLTVALEQARAVYGLLLAHAVEYRRERWKVVAEPLGVIGVHPFVLFLERNGQGQDFSLGEAVEAAHSLPSSSHRSPRRGTRPPLEGLSRATAASAGGRSQSYDSRRQRPYRDG